MQYSNYLNHDYKYIHLEQQKDYLHIALNRPDKLNAVNMDMLEELWRIFEGLNLDTSIRAVLLSGKGKAFCAGLDLTGPLAEGSSLNNNQRIAIQRRLSRLLALVHNISQPVVSAAQGAACGFGLGLLCASDIRYGSPSLKANAAFLKLGFTGCDMGVSYFLPKIVGLTAANEMMLTGRFYNAEKLEKKGFLAEISQEEDLITISKSTVVDMLKASPFGLRMTKEGIRHNLNANSLESALAMEDRQQILSGYSGDQMRALTSFISGTETDFMDD